MTTPRCVLCGRPEDEATPSFSTYLHGVASRCPECGKPQGADLVDRAEVEGELADLRAEADTMRHRIAALREALEDVREWATHDHVMRFDDGDVPLADYCTQAIQGEKP